MSGIAGIFKFRGEHDSPCEIVRLTRAMQHRGPDGTAQWTHGSIALGHCQLRVDSNARFERQPVIAADGRHVLVMDGRIDNRLELRGALAKLGIAPRDESDPELVLCAFQAWQEETPQRLLGEFAFAAWDSHQHGLFLARDQIGARFVHYRIDGDAFAFATEDEALLTLDGARCVPNEARIASLFSEAFAHYDPEDSWLDGIFMLPPGTHLRISADGQLKRTQYWKLQPQPELRLHSDDDYDEAFRSVFLNAVQRRLQTLQPPALMLSGGIDSLAVVGAARELHRRGLAPPLHTWSLVSNEADCAESARIRSAAIGYESISHHLAVGTALTPEDQAELCRTLWSHPHPIDNSLPAVQWLAMRAARTGQRALLSGVGGDLALYAPVYYMAPSLRFGSLASTCKELALARRHSPYLRGERWHALLPRVLWHSQAMDPLRRAKQRLTRVDSVGPLQEFSFLAPETRDRLRAYLAERSRESGGSHRERQQQAQASAMRTGSLHCGLEGYGRTAARQGTESLDPWSDREVIDFCLSLPLSQRSGGGWTKLIARRACSRWLPDDLAWNSSKDHLGRHVLSAGMHCAPEASPLLSHDVDKPERDRVRNWLAGQEFHRYCDPAQQPYVNYFRCTTLAWLERVERIAFSPRQA